MIETEYKNQQIVENERNYPWIGISSSSDGKGLVVLFTCPGEGFILRSPSSKIGVYSTVWKMENFVPLKSPITLKNT